MPIVLYLFIGFISHLLLFYCDHWLSVVAMMYASRKTTLFSRKKIFAGIRRMILDEFPWSSPLVKSKRAFCFFTIAGKVPWLLFDFAIDLAVSYVFGSRLYISATLFIFSCFKTSFLSHEIVSICCYITMDSIGSLGTYIDVHTCGLSLVS